MEERPSSAQWDWGWIAPDAPKTCFDCTWSHKSIPHLLLQTSLTHYKSRSVPLAPRIHVILNPEGPIGPLGKMPP